VLYQQDGLSPMGLAIDTDLGRHGGMVVTVLVNLMRIWPMMRAASASPAPLLRAGFAIEEC